MCRSKAQRGRRCSARTGRTRSTRPGTTRSGAVGTGTTPMGRTGTTTTVRLSLLRAPRCPDPYADQGHHRFTYALLPGASIGDAIAEGYALNLPPRSRPGSRAVPPPPLVRVAGDAVVVEAVKLADDRSGDVVVRLYESRGGRATARLGTGFPLAGAAVCDLLERPLEELAVEPEGELPLTLRPFQILTLRLTPV